jgi:hypothetical protein
MKKTPVKKVIFILLILTPFFFIKAQTKESNTLNLSGNIYLDSRLSVNYYDSLNTTPNLQNPRRKSQYLAGLMSFLVPGAGEVYSENYLKAAIFLVVEAAAITTAMIYNHKGDYQTSFFQSFANQHWSALRYAQWTLNNIKNINSDVDGTQYAANGSKPVISYTNGVPTGVNWSNLNSLELELGSGYSHQLPQFGDQQYYELIGKYPQFSHGWDDSKASDTDFHVLSYSFDWYTHQRAVANQYYKASAFGVSLIYINHALSTLDAIWSMDKYNDNLTANVSINSMQMADHIELIPTLNLSFNF